MTGLIIEGGARRGIFTAGITDCLLENKIHFDYVAGVSAGAEVALDFTAKQEGRSRRVIICPTEQAIFRFSVFFQWIFTI